MFRALITHLGGLSSKFPVVGHSPVMLRTQIVSLGVVEDNGRVKTDSIDGIEGRYLDPSEIIKVEEFKL